ncbi:MAG: HEAT repeat domain-containing protein [Nitrospirae bacterium]|nr:HEAT repeat domain-containing protein [Nitrospirota bacterium]
MEQNLYDMIADYMEKGFLDNIIDMFRYDPDVYPVAPRLISDERIRVRLGAIALLESLAEIGYAHLGEIADAIAPLLSSDNPLIRGDAAYGLGIIGLDRHIPTLETLLNDETQDISEAALDSISEIMQRASTQA